MTLSVIHSLAALIRIRSQCHHLCAQKWASIIALVSRRKWFSLMNCESGKKISYFLYSFLVLSEILFIFK